MFPAYAERKNPRINVFFSGEILPCLVRVHLTPPDKKEARLGVLLSACQKRSPRAVFFAILKFGDEDAKERSRTAASDRDAMRGHAGAERSS
ncbi:MAG: hypothetical protein SPE01_12405, partial [Candidatus Spyradocola sp.]|nr:hypothetical protein [Candidatus Spyradocola sp.]